MVINAASQQITSELTVKATLKIQHKALKQAEELLNNRKNNIILVAKAA